MKSIKKFLAEIFGIEQEEPIVDRTKIFGPTWEELGRPFPTTWMEQRERVASQADVIELPRSRLIYGSIIALPILALVIIVGSWWGANWMISTGRRTFDDYFLEVQRYIEEVHRFIELEKQTRDALEGLPADIANLKAIIAELRANNAELQANNARLEAQIRAEKIWKWGGLFGGALLGVIFGELFRWVKRKLQHKTN